MPLADSAEASTADGARHRLRRDATHGWMLERHGRAEHTDGRGANLPGWAPQYSFTEERVWPADLRLANHWTATAPASRFTQAPVVSIVLPRGFASLLGRRYARANGGDRTEAEIGSAKAYRLRLGMLFGIELSPDEADALFACAAPGAGL